MIADVTQVLHKQTDKQTCYEPQPSYSQGLHRFPNHVERKPRLLRGQVRGTAKRNMSSFSNCFLPGVCLSVCLSVCMDVWLVGWFIG